MTDSNSLWANHWIW